MGGSAKASADFGPGLEEMEILDPNGNSTEWQMSSPMEIGRSYLASAAGEGHIYVVGGCLTEGVSTAETFDIKTVRLNNYLRLWNLSYKIIAICRVLIVP